MRAMWLSRRCQRQLRTTGVPSAWFSTRRPIALGRTTALVFSTHRCSEQLGVTGPSPTVSSSPLGTGRSTQKCILLPNTRDHFTPAPQVVAGDDIVLLGGLLVSADERSAPMPRTSLRLAASLNPQSVTVRLVTVTSLPACANVRIDASASSGSAGSSFSFSCLHKLYVCIRKLTPAQGTGAHWSARSSHQRRLTSRPRNTTPSTSTWA